MYDAVTVYHRLFYYKEGQGVLNPFSDIHLYALHCIFLPHINTALDMFRKKDGIHTRLLVQEGLYTEGMLTTKHSGLPALDYFNEVDSDYGHGDEGFVPDTIDYERVVVLPIDINVTSQQLQLSQSISINQDEDMYGLNTFEQIVHVLSQ